MSSSDIMTSFVGKGNPGNGVVVVAQSGVEAKPSTQCLNISYANHARAGEAVSEHMPKRLPVVEALFSNPCSEGVQSRIWVGSTAIPLHSTGGVPAFMKHNLVDDKVNAHLVAINVVRVGDNLLQPSENFHMIQIKTC